MKMNNEQVVANHSATNEIKQAQAEQLLYNLLFTGRISMKEYLEEIKRKEKQHLN
jgi:hypothetical protein